MGYRRTWIASRGAPTEVVLAALGLDRIDSHGEAVFDPGIFGVNLPGDWFVVLAHGWDYMGALCEQQAIALSSSHECWFFRTDDTPMCTRLAVYANGHCACSITYDGSLAPPPSTAHRHHFWPPNYASGVGTRQATRTLTTSTGSQRTLPNGCSASATTGRSVMEFTPIHVLARH